MISVGNNVFSLLGFPITEIPVFKDKSTRKKSFYAKITDDEISSELISGDQIVFGLILHRSLEGVKFNNVKFNKFHKWTISEPNSGLRVAIGRTRVEALQDLALKVAYLGGDDNFKAVLTEFKSRNIYNDKRAKLNAKAITK